MNAIEIKNIYISNNPSKTIWHVVYGFTVKIEGERVDHVQLSTVSFAPQSQWKCTGVKKVRTKRTYRFEKKMENEQEKHVMAIQSVEHNRFVGYEIQSFEKRRI